MGMPLSALGASMTSEEFALHMALEVKRQGRDEPPDDWD